MHALLLAFALGSSSASAARCNQAVSPHSFACADETFTGGVFPVPVLSQDMLVGPWIALTYSAVNDQQGPEFRTLVNPQNPRIPEGITNRADGSLLGGFDWTPGRLRLGNWGARGVTLAERRGSTKMVDARTVQTFLDNGRTSAGLQCRIFVRNRNDHLLCRWFSIVNGKPVLRGYLGFLRAQ